MQAIIFANRDGKELAPLDSYYCPALLPISNKSIIEYTLEDLAEAGIERVKLVVSTQVSEIKVLVGNGERWGLEVEYFLSKQQEDISKIIPRLALDKTESILLARGDMLRSPCIKNFVQFSQQMSQSFVIAKLDEQNAGLMMLPAAVSYTEELNWPLCNDAEHTGNKHNIVTQVLHGDCFMLTTLDEYMRANQAMALRKVIGAEPKGRFCSSADEANGFYVGAQTKTGQLRMQNAWGIIGDNTWIDESVNMQQSVIVGKNCLIDARSSLKNCIILDDSYVGQGLNVSNAIICNNMLLTPSTGGAIRLNDDSIIAKNHNKAANRKVKLLDKLCAFLLFILGILISPVLLVASLASSNKKTFIKDIITLNNTNFACWRWNLNSLFLSRLPQLYLVVLGRLHLFGRTPFLKQDQGFNDNEFGLYGPLQLRRDVVLEEERQLVETEFMLNKQKSQRWKLIKQSFSYSPPEPQATSEATKN
ncbi:sugar phosphate nucleotidyltransferase [Shewanella pealeana]|uniref:Translation initiation factor eIF2B subunit gamma n=1 Tax=Shewanella pealeana (strain ATCC 700345 / ANG-SQ1) TaxID=398579 RepID=A8H2G1_SHEPA|nr:NDP-sugar synthase [Shewanella pealeana]ABV86748.1 nucleotidyl transferase [Shewanella pealeana ATCC 700345]